MITSAAPTQITHTLAIGNPYVSENRILQRALTTHGYAVTPDGVFGPRTQAAVMGFQTRHGLSADGILGPVTARALGIG